VSILFEIVLTGSQGKHRLKSTAKTMWEGKKLLERKESVESRESRESKESMKCK
jgi:hypothetical protein